MHIVMLKKRMLLNFLSLLLMPALPVAAAETTGDFPASEVHEDDVQAHLKAEEKHEDIRYPRLTLHGDYRFLYGKGRFNAETPDWRTGKSPRIDQSVFRAERRLRLFPFIETSKETSVRTMLEDKRDSKDETRNRHLTLSRLYLQHENPHTKLEAGRFNYYLMDGNIIDKRIDGLRFRTGGEDWPHGSLTVFAGRTTGTASSQKDGFSLLWKKRTGKLGFHTAYLDFRQREKLPKSYPQLHQLGLTAGRAGHGYDHQRIFSATIRYHPREDWTLGLELLQAQAAMKRTITGKMNAASSPACSMASSTKKRPGVFPAGSAITTSHLPQYSGTRWMPTPAFFAVRAFAASVYARTTSSRPAFPVPSKASGSKTARKAHCSAICISTSSARASRLFLIREPGCRCLRARVLSVPPCSSAFLGRFHSQSDNALIACFGKHIANVKANSAF